MALFILFSGFCVRLVNIKVYWKWIYWSSFFQAGFTAALINEFEGLNLTCSSPICPYPNGNSVLELLGIQDSRDKWESVWVLLGLSFGARVLNFFVLKFLHKEKN